MQWLWWICFAYFLLVWLGVMCLASVLFGCKLAYLLGAFLLGRLEAGMAHGPSGLFFRLAAGLTSFGKEAKL